MAAQEPAVKRDRRSCEDAATEIGASGPTVEDDLPTPGMERAPCARGVAIVHVENGEADGPVSVPSVPIALRHVEAAIGACEHDVARHDFHAQAIVGDVGPRLGGRVAERHRRQGDDNGQGEKGGPPHVAQPRPLPDNGGAV